MASRVKGSPVLRSSNIRFVYDEFRWLIVEKIWKWSKFVSWTMHNPSTHCNYTHSSHSYHPRSQESERFRLSVHYGCWVLMCCEWDGPWLQHHFCLLCRQDLKLWSSVKRVNKFLEATAALFFCLRVTLHERRGTRENVKTVQSSRLKKICENQEWCHVRNWGFRASGAGCMGSQGSHCDWFEKYEV